MRWLARILVGLVALTGLAVAGVAAAAFLVYQSLVRDLPDLEDIEDYRPPLASTVVARDGRPIGEFYEQRRRLVRLEDVPQRVVRAFVAAEDDAFFEHSGIDVRSILRAAWVNFTAGDIEQGASTITQQTVKSLLLTPERRYDRKLKEMILARRLEQHLGKDEILAIYLNQIYFGSGAWGIGEAARTYFGKSVEELDAGEAALLAGLPKAPSRYSPRVNPERAETRRRYVLGRMLQLGFLTPEEYERFASRPPALASPPEEENYAPAAWFTEEVRRTLYDRLGGDVVRNGGLHIETTLDLDLQRRAETALRHGLEALDRRQGWQGAVRRVPTTALAAEAERLAAANGLPAGADAGALVPGRGYLGVVTRVDARADTASVALAPGIVGTVRLADVRWAHPRDPNKLFADRTRIGQVFETGMVARFALPAPEAEAADAGEGTEPAEAGDGAATEEASADGGLQLVLHQEPKVEGALIGLDVDQREVLSLVGGYDFTRSQFDRAVQARRQPGSSFKPFIYAAALSHGLTAVTIVDDSQVVYADPTTGEVWKPANYDHRFRGPLPLREALARSLNNATVRVLLRVGIRPVVDLARRLGIRSPIAPYPSLALGTSPVTLLEIVRAYAVFAAGGQRVTPVFVRRVVDRDGRVLLENVPLVEPPAAPDATTPAVASAPADDTTGPQQILDPAHAFLVADLLRAPIEHPGGTSRRALALKRPAAGKTGTTDDQGDAWFVGFTPDVAAGVWVGFDERDVLGRGETGGRAALPIWVEFMQAAHEGRPVRDFPVPEGVSYARVDPSTGKLDDAGGGSGVFQPFLSGSEPTETSSGSQGEVDSHRVLRMDF